MNFPANFSEHEFFRENHIKYCVRCLGVIPEMFETLDSIRPVVAYFAITTLDLLDALDRISGDRNRIIEWIYSLQVKSCGDEKVDYGFRGSTTCVCPQLAFKLTDKPQLAATYSALNSLVILGDDLSRVNKVNILRSMRELQLPNGSFRNITDDCECDMRFLYSAAAICYMLDDFSGIDEQMALKYIRNCLNYDGGIGLKPDAESHGGSTYCAVATLWLLGKLDSFFSPGERKKLVRWLIFRQEDGFNGRPNKDLDTCYTFWIGATLKLLDCYNIVNYHEISRFVFANQDEITGGIARSDSQGTDLIHTSLSIGGLMLYDMNQPARIHPALNMSQRAAVFLDKLHKEWDQSR